MLILLENINEAGALLLLFCGYACCRHFKKTKWERKLTPSEWMIYITTTIAVFLFAGTWALLFLDSLN